MAEEHGKLGKHPRVHLRDAAEEAGPDVKPTDAKQLATRYQIVGEIARGGVGVIYKGRDVDLGRDVAMKVLRSDFVDNPDIVQRFVDEAQIGGQLQHPGVVPVYELGMKSDELPYFSMKLIKGKTLSALLTERRDASSERPRFLGIFAQVCQAMAYAHARGVIHRDLKSANVMVGAFGEVQVVDWGFAKVLGQGGIVDERKAKKRPPPMPDVTIIATKRSGSGSEGSHSMTGSVMGTPAYMPPEQALGLVDELDERSDVFALGAILCEILTGQPPYTGEKKLVAAAQANLEDAFERLANCGAEEALVELTKLCLHKEQPKRPGDATIVAKAISQHLAAVEERERDSQRVEVEAQAKADAARAKAETHKKTAEAEHARAQSERKARRLTLGIAATLLLGVVAAGWMHLSSIREGEARVAGAVARVDEQLRDAARLGGEARGAKAGDLSLWEAAIAAAKKAEGLAQEADADTQARVQARLEELQEGKTRAAKFGELRAREQGVVAQLEEIRARRGDAAAAPVADKEYTVAFRSLGLDVQGDPEQVARKIRGSRVSDALVEALDDWAWTRRNRGVEGWQRLVEIAQQADRDHWRNGLREAIAKNDVRTLEALAAAAAPAELNTTSLHLLAVSLAHAGNAEVGVSILTAACERHPDDPLLNHHLGLWLMKLEQPRREDAVRYLSAALALRPRAAGILNDLGIALDGLGEHDAAIRAYDDALRLKPDYAPALNNRGMAYLGKGETERALQHFKKALGVNPDYAYAHYSVGKVLYGTDLDAAIASFRKARELQPGLEPAWSSLVEALVAKKQLDEAVKVARRATREHPYAAWSHHNLGFALGVQGKYEEAIQPLERAIKLDATRASAHHDLGSAYASLGRFKEALEPFRRAARLQPRVARYLRDAALVHTALLAHEDALVYARRAVAVDPGDWLALGDLGDALRHLGKFDEAKACFEKLLEWPDPVVQADGQHGLGAMYGQQGMWDKAVEHLAQADKLFATKELMVRGRLGGALAGAGRFDEALEVFAAVHAANVALKSRSALTNLPPPEETAAAVREMEAAVRVAGVFDELLSGKREPRDADERLALARVCEAKKHYAEAAKHYRAVLVSHPDVYAEAAAAAVLAGCRRGKRGHELSDARCVELRTQGRAWLRKELARLLRLYEDPVNLKTVLVDLGEHFHFPRYGQLSVVAPGANLDILRKAEREEWVAFWDEVDEAMSEVGGS